MSLVISTKSMTSGFMLLAAFVLPYVSFEPAPVDFALLLAAMVFLAKGGQLSKVAFFIALVYLGFYLAAGLSSLIKGQQNDAKFIRYYFVETFLIFTTVVSYSIFVAFPGLIDRFLKYYCIGSVVSCFAVLVIYYGLPSYDGIYRDSSRIRITGFFKDPNVLGPYLIFPALMLIFSPTRLNIKPIWRLGAIPLLIVLVLTYSRASLGSFLVSALVLFLMRVLTGMSRNGFILSIALGFLIVALVPFQIDRIDSQLQTLENLRARMTLQSYDQSRFYDIKNAFVVGAGTLFGLGPASYETMFDALSPHNLFLAKLVDGGWIPALIISWFMVYPTWIAFKMFMARRDELLLVLFCVFLAHSMMSMIINPHHWRHLLLLCAITFAMSNARAALPQRQAAADLKAAPS